MRSVDPAASRPPWDVHEATESFCFRDAHGQALADVWDLWFSGAYPNARAIQGPRCDGNNNQRLVGVTTSRPNALPKLPSPQGCQVLTHLRGYGMRGVLRPH